MVGNDNDGRRFHNADDREEEKRAERGMDHTRSWSDKTMITVNSATPTSSRGRSAHSNDRGVSGIRIGINSDVGISTSSSIMPAPRVPPHRRTTSLMERVAKDKKSLRELKMDDGFLRIQIKNIAP